MESAKLAKEIGVDNDQSDGQKEEEEVDET